MPGLNSLPFLWGAATSAHQVEGDNEDNDWHDWERAPGSPCAEISGRACDHVNRYGEDIALLGELGLNCYRFSVEWSRVEPEPGRFSERWIAHYRRMLECCHQHRLLPVLTMHHFTNPRWIAAAGGWEQPRTAELFGRYCGVLAEALGDLASLVITINEPNIPPLLGYENGVFPPGKRDRAARVRVSELFIEGHRQAVDALRRQSPGVPVGLALAMADWQSLPGGERELDEVRNLREDMFLQATQDDDFVGVNTYTRHRLGPEGWVGNEPGVELTAAGYEFWPQALEATLKRASQMIGGRPVIVTESGIATDDDRRRIVFIDRSIAAMQAAIRAGCDVRGFIHWSALDNFEWHCGYGQHFGLVAVDRDSEERTVKPSARHFGTIATLRSPTALSCSADAESAQPKIERSSAGR